MSTILDVKKMFGESMSVIGYRYYLDKAVPKK
jgi:hypothetical protein